jgi:hypothetical protein
MSSSYGHHVKIATDDDKRRQGCSNSPTCPICGNPSVPFLVTYLYVTGRKGRVTRNVRFVCENHARSFATKHNLEMPTPQDEKAA